MLPLIRLYLSDERRGASVGVSAWVATIKNWGRGIEIIVVACERLGALRPEYKVIGYGITLHLYALEPAIIRDNKGSELASNDTLGGGMDSEEFRSVPKIVL